MNFIVLTIKVIKISILRATTMLADWYAQPWPEEND